MASAKPQKILRHSVLDRLTKTDPRSGSRLDLSISVREMREAVRRDLEWLLNSRSAHDLREVAGEETRKSILVYGLPDLTSFSRESATDRRTVCAMIKEIIRVFEPRLVSRTVHVDYVPVEAKDDFRMHFRIQGLLHVEPIVEPVSFDTSFEADSGLMTVRES